MKRTDFNYDLPPDLIAQRPLESRSASRLLCLDKSSGAAPNPLQAGTGGKVYQIRQILIGYTALILQGLKYFQICLIELKIVHRQ